MYESYKALKVERRDAVLWITMDNPPLNGSTPEIHRELSTIFREVSYDKETRCVVLTGAGDRGFSAGGNVGGMLEGISDQARWTASMKEGREIVLNILECDKPIIGRINGHAIGLGASIALCCDITIITDHAKIGDTHTKIGLSCGDGGSLIWPHLVGLVTARRWLLSGDIMTGKEAAAIGLVTESHPAEEYDAAVQKWIDRFANGATMSIAATKRSLNMAIKRDATMFMDAMLGLETLTHLSKDHVEAITAFVEKREPAFKGD